MGNIKGICARVSDLSPLVITASCLMVIPEICIRLPKPHSCTRLQPVCSNRWINISYVCWHSREASISTHYDDVIMTMLASQITSLTVVYLIVYSAVNQRKYQSSASLAFVREIHRGPVNFPHKWPVTRKMFPFDDVIMIWYMHNPLIKRSWRKWYFISICGGY